MIYKGVHCDGRCVRNAVGVRFVLFELTLDINFLLIGG